MLGEFTYVNFSQSSKGIQHYVKEGEVQLLADVIAEHMVEAIR